MATPIWVVHIDSIRRDAMGILVIIDDHDDCDNPSGDYALDMPTDVIYHLDIGIDVDDYYVENTNIVDYAIMRTYEEVSDERHIIRELNIIGDEER